MLYGSVSTSNKKTNFIEDGLLSTTQITDLSRHKKICMFGVIISLVGLSIFPKPLLHFITVNALSEI